ncbi:hypothetical protein B0H21DRAFT_684947 [Amylocystis lapponica]|nr:hypothetical protein B0H21DRAFT_684947 [Amylocystis lapponica]
MSKRPSAIIFGGLNTCSRALAAHLVPPEGDSLVENLRMVDKYSVAPPTTYIGAEFPKVLAKPNVEYRQANLTVPATVASCFDPPEGQDPYTYVFDFSGEIQWDRPEKVQIASTLKVARSIGLEAARRKVTAYVRVQHPYYDYKEKGPTDETAEFKVDGLLDAWWHETLRALGAIEDLNLVIVRTGFVYGPYVDYGLIPPFVAVSACYGHMKQPMKSIWAPGKFPMHTVHVEDVAGAMWACAVWMAGVGGRKEADKIAGVKLPFLNDKSKAEEVEDMAPPTQTIVAPLFNIADDSQMTMVELGTTLANTFGAPFEFYNFLINTMAKFKLEDVLEDINDTHVTTWTEMITTSNPPVSNTHYSPYMDQYNLRRHPFAASNERVKRIVGYTLRHPHFTRDTILDMVDKLKAEGSWPQNNS